MDAPRRALARAGEAGDVEAAARALRERIRGGLLGRERVVLAALVGDEAARLAVAYAGPAPAPEVADRVEQVLVQAPVGVVTGWGLDVAARAAEGLDPAAAAPLLALLPAARGVTELEGAAALRAVRTGPAVMDALRVMERADPRRFEGRPAERPERVLAFAVDLTLWRWLQPDGLRQEAIQVGRAAAAAGLATFEWQLAAVVERLLRPRGA